MYSVCLFFWLTEGLESIHNPFSTYLPTYRLPQIVRYMLNISHDTSHVPLFLVTIKL